MDWEDYNFLRQCLWPEYGVSSVPKLIMKEEGGWGRRRKRTRNSYRLVSETSYGIFLYIF